MKTGVSEVLMKKMGFNKCVESSNESPHEETETRTDSHTELWLADPKVLNFD